MAKTLDYNNISYSKIVKRVRGEGGGLTKLHYYCVILEPYIECR